MNFFTHVFQGFQLDFKLLFIQWGCFSDGECFIFKLGEHPMGCISFDGGGDRKKLQDEVDAPMSSLYGKPCYIIMYICRNFGYVTYLGKKQKTYFREDNFQLVIFHSYLNRMKDCEFGCFIQKTVSFKKKIHTLTLRIYFKKYNA